MTKDGLNLPVGSFALANGLAVVVQTDRTSPTVAVALTYKVGSRDERPGRSGFAHLFEHLMAQGTKSLKPRELSTLIESAGGLRNAHTTKNHTSYYSLVPRGALELVLWAEAERMSELNVDARALALEKQVVLEEARRSYLNQPYRQALDRSLAEASFSRWENRHPTIGELEDIRNATLDDVRAFYAAHYRPGNAVLALAGDVGLDEARELVEKRFGPLPSQAAPPASDFSEPALEGQARLRVEDPLAELPRLAVAWRLPARGDADFWPLAMLMHVLSGRDENPLYRDLVKERQAALSASAGFPWWSSVHSLSEPDMFGFDVLLKTGADPDAVLGRVDALLDEIARRGPSAEDLERARASAELDALQGLTFLLDRAKTLSAYAALVGPPEGLAEEIGRLLAVSAEDVRRAVSRRMLGRGRAVLHVAPGTPGRPIDEPPTPPVPEAAPRPPGEPPPPVAAPRRPRPPSLSRLTLSNGLKVLAARDERFPLFEARLIVDAGRVRETPGEEGLALASAGLMFKGAAGKDAATIAGTLARLGGAAGARAGLELMHVSASGLSRNAEPFFSCLGEVLAQADYPEAETALWTRNQAERLKELRKDPEFLSGERLKAELFPGHPYASGQPDETALAAVSSAKLRAFHARMIRPERSALVLVGDLDPDAALRSLEKAFAGSGRPAAKESVPPAPDPGAARRALIDRQGSAQANLSVARSIDLAPGHPDMAAFAVMNQLLGGSSTSRLFVNLRVEHGYTYGAYSGASQLSRALLWEAGAETRYEVAGPALREMGREIRRLREELVSAETLKAATTYMSGLFAMRLASIDRLASTLAQYEQHGLDAERELSTWLDRLAALTPEDVRRAARLYLDPDRMLVIAVGDLRSLEPALAGASL